MDGCWKHGVGFRPNIYVLHIDYVAVPAMQINGKPYVTSKSERSLYKGHCYGQAHILYLRQ